MRKRKNRTQSDLAAALNLKRTTVNAVENGISQPTINHLQAFSRHFGIAMDTLVNIDLTRLSESQFTDIENGFDVFLRGTNLRMVAVSVDPQNYDNIELVNEKAKAGYVTSFADPEYIGKLPVFQLPFLSKEKKYRAFTISGESMLPIPDGAIIIGEFIPDFYNIKPNEGYIFVTRDEGIVFKIAGNKIDESRSIKLISLNPDFDPFRIPLTEIKEAWKFVCYLNTEIPEPETDIQKVLKKVNEVKDEIKKLKC
ncbi:MAG TPA: helix-turn-helix domain-containing protein [Prolixibacteraceae bacterium]|nr:helix-turn-helix domain-containing protein [Prolixibacteraceae bacterium]